MTHEEMMLLKKEYGAKLTVTKAVHVMDEDDWNEWTIAYDHIIVGSELVDIDFVRGNIDAMIEKEKHTSPTRKLLDKLPARILAAVECHKGIKDHTERRLRASAYTMALEDAGVVTSLERRMLFTYMTL